MVTIKTKALLAVVIFAVLLGTGCKKILNNNPLAGNALTTLKKLQAKTETGITYQDYSTALGDTNFSVKEYLDSDEAKSSSEFASAIHDALKWYSVAGETWNASTQAYDAANFESCSGSYSHVKTLCSEHPELVSIGYGIGVSGVIGETQGIHFKQAVQQSWENAGAEVQKANAIFVRQKQ